MMYQEDGTLGTTYMQEESSCQEREPLAVPNFFIIDCICLADLVQCILTHPTCLLEVIMSREGAVDVPEDHLVTGAVLVSEGEKEKKEMKPGIAEVLRPHYINSCNFHDVLVSPAHIISLPSPWLLALGMFPSCPGSGSNRPAVATPLPSKPPAHRVLLGLPHPWEAGGSLPASWEAPSGGNTSTLTTLHVW